MSEAQRLLNMAEAIIDNRHKGGADKQDWPELGASVEKIPHPDGEMSVRFIRNGMFAGQRKFACAEHAEVYIEKWLNHIEQQRVAAHVDPSE